MRYARASGRDRTTFLREHTVSRAFGGAEDAFSCDKSTSWSLRGAPAERTPLEERSRRVGQGRALPARRESLEGPCASVFLNHAGGWTAARRSWWRLRGRGTADLTIAAENCAGNPVRMHRHSFVPQGRMVFRPQPGGLAQFAGLARDGGHTSFAELAPWLCPNRSARLA
jgi:hypothetical protein